MQAEFEFTEEDRNMMWELERRNHIAARNVKAIMADYADKQPHCAWARSPERREEIEEMIDKRWGAPFRKWRAIELETEDQLRRLREKKAVIETLKLMNLAPVRKPEAVQQQAPIPTVLERTRSATPDVRARTAAEASTKAATPIVTPSVPSAPPATPNGAAQCGGATQKPVQPEPANEGEPPRRELFARVSKEVRRQSQEYAMKNPAPLPDLTLLQERLIPISALHRPQAAAILPAAEQPANDNGLKWESDQNHTARIAEPRSSHSFANRMSRGPGGDLYGSGIAYPNSQHAQRRTG